MQMQVHHHSKDRKNAVALSAHPAPQRRILRAIPQIGGLRVNAEIVPSESALESQAFSPLIQEFLDECGYTDK